LRCPTGPASTPRWWTTTARTVGKAGGGLVEVVPRAVGPPCCAESGGRPGALTRTPNLVAVSRRQGGYYFAGGTARSWTEDGDLWAASVRVDDVMKRLRATRHLHHRGWEGHALSRAPEGAPEPGRGSAAADATTRAGDRGVSDDQRARRGAAGRGASGDAFVRRNWRGPRGQGDRARSRRPRQILHPRTAQ